jgi:gliding motility-associated-like protein
MNLAHSYKKTRSAALIVFLLMTSLAGFSQAVVQTTVNWTTGWCNICGPTTGNYACAQGSGSGNWNNGIRTFSVSIPAGNIVTGVCVQVNKVDCGLTNLCVNINNQQIQCMNVAPGTNCGCGTCWPQTFCNSYSCPNGLPNFNYNGTNTLQLINTGNLCVNNAVITLTYQVCCIQPTVTAVASSTAICTGQSSTITANGAGPGGTYTINPGNITNSVAVVSPTATTIYTISGTNTNSCTNTRTLQIQVNPTPTVTPGSNSPICRNSALNLTVNASAGGTVSYNWTGPNGFTSTLQNPSIALAQGSNTGVYSVNVVASFTNGGSCQNTGTTSVFVINTNTVSTSNPTVCQGSPITLTAGVVGASSFSWTGPNNYTAAVQNPPSIPNSLPVMAGNYIITAYFTTPGTTLVCTSTAVTNASVVATSPVTVTVPNNICQYSTAVITATTSPMAPSFSWMGPNNFTATGASTAIANIQPAATGLYNVTAMWSIGTVSCTINGANQINVVGVPDVNINQPINVCDPSNVQLTSSSPGAISYNWTATNGFTSNVSSPLLTSPGPTATGVYTVSTAYTNGALTCFNSNTTQVTVNPILTFTLPAYKQTCFNSVYTVNGPAGATSYTWAGAGGFTSNNQILSIPSIQSGQAGTYTLTVNLGPCTTSATTKVDVLSPISFTQTPGDKVICAGESVTLALGSTGGSQNYAYNWNPSIYLGSPTGSVQYGQPLGTTIYNVTAYDINCPNYTISTSFTVTVNKAPTPDLQLEKTEGCQPLCLTYNSRTQQSADMITYDFGNGQLMQADSFAYCLDQPGTYTLRIQTKGKNGCSAIYTHPAPIVVWPTPHSDINWDPEAPSTTNNHITFYPANQYGPITNYLWQFQGTNATTGNDTSSAKNPMRTYDNTGKYPVMLVSRTDKGCIDTVFKVIEIKEEFTIFIPNSFTPNGDGLNDVFNIKGLGLKTEGYSMEIYDRWGELVYTTKDAYKGWDGTVKGIYAPNGVYVYKVKALGANGEGKKEFVGHVTLLK